MVIFDLQVQGYINSTSTGDFNSDGRLDLLITRTHNGQSTVEIYLQRTNSFDLVPTRVFNKTLGHPSVIDLNCDSYPDIVLNGRVGTSDSQALVYEQQRLDRSFLPRPLLDYAFLSLDHCISPTHGVLRTPHSTAFVDLNGDCLADLFLTTLDALGNQFFEIWLNMKNGEYCVVQIAQAPVGAGQVSFADVDRNGVEDVVFPVCVDNSCIGGSEIHVIFNDNNDVPRCKFDNNIISYKRFKPLDLFANETSTGALVQPLPSGLSYPLSDEDAPLTLRTGDFDLDGFPELIVTVESNSGTFCGLFANVEGLGLQRRAYTLRESDEFRKLRDKTGAVMCAFFDLDENGVLDVVLSVMDKNGKYLTYSFYNNFLDDAYRLKAMVLSSESSFSSSYSGPVLMFSFLRLDMSLVKMHATQQPQSAYFALIPPYCVFGIGRVISYIEDFHATVPTLAHSSRWWSPVIPNSYLIVCPTKTDVERWQLLLFHNPEARVGWAMVGVAIFLCLVGSWAVCRRRREHNADKRAIIEELLASR